MKFATILTALAFGLAGGSAALAQTATETWRLGGLKMPESVIVDTANARLIVGNMGTFGPDGGMDGYLSIVSTDGKLVTENWVGGLMDPKGMAIVGGSLFVVDATGVVEISLADGSTIRSIPLAGAVFPNDATTDGSAVYVSDFMGQAIYKIVDGVAEQWLADPALASPNGLLVDGNALIVGSMGTGMKPDFSFETQGGLQSIDLASKALTPTDTMGSAMVDGVARVGDALVYDNNPAGTIISYAGGKATTLATLSPGAADLFVDGNMIYVPLTQTGELVALKLE